MSFVRHLISGPWKGVNEFRETEMDMAITTGIELISWYTTTLAGTSMFYSSLIPQVNCCVVGLGGGSLPSFLSRYSQEQYKITCIELSYEIAKAAELWFGLSVEQTLLSNSEKVLAKRFAPGSKSPIVVALNKGSNAKNNNYYKKKKKRNEISDNN
eukprot:Pgem_evm1s11119